MSSTDSLPIAFVAGATGYTGEHVVSALRERGITTHAHVRPESRQHDEWVRTFGELGAVVDSTPWKPAAIAETIARIRPSLTFALLGTTRARVRHEPGASYESVDYGLTHMLLAAARAHAPHTLFVYLSAIGARDDSRNRYVAARGRIERELRDSGLACLIVRPALISGADRRERRPTERLAARLTDAGLDIVRLLGGRRFHDAWSSLTGTELGTGIVRLALRGARGIVGPADLRH